jgi:metal-responsive CopG/Arc/MetJ family transcriptional regulator
MNVAPGVGEDQEILVRLPGDILRALDRFVAEQGYETRSQAMLSALHEWAHRRGYMSEAGEEGIRPEDLNAGNDG